MGGDTDVRRATYVQMAGPGPVSDDKLIQPRFTCAPPEFGALLHARGHAFPSFLFFFLFSSLLFHTHPINVFHIQVEFILAN